MEPYGEEFDEVRGDSRTLLYVFRSSPLSSGRYLSAFTARKDIAIVRQHTRTKDGLKEIAIGFNREQLEELQNLIPQLLKEMEHGRTPDEDLEQARRDRENQIDSLQEGTAKTAFKNISEILNRTK